MAKVKYTKKNLQNRKELFPVGKKSKISKQKPTNEKKKKLGSSLVDKTTKEQSNQNIISIANKTSATHKDGDSEFGKDDTRKVTFTKDQMENWNSVSEERFDNVARIIETAKQFILNRSHGLYYDSVKSAITLSEKRILASLKELRVPQQPTTKAPTQFKDTTARNLDQLELHECEIEFTISKQNEACEKLQEELTRVEATKENSKMHPFLQGHFESSLKLPIYKKFGT